MEEEEADSSPCSQGRLQMSHQMTNSSPYLPESFLPDKVGELMAAQFAYLIGMSSSAKIHEEKESQLAYGS